MFNGVPDQFHQFGPSLPFPLSFPLHHHQHHHGPMSPSSSSTPSPLQSFPSGCFDLYPPPSVLQLQQSCIAKKEKEEEDAVAAGTGTGSSNILATNNNNVAVVLGMEDGVNDDERSMYHHHHHHESSSTFDDLWSNDEVVALFKIRSGLQENWFPDFTNWDHVSRKLAELGYQRSAEKCKEKFEEESRQFNDDINYNKNYRFLTELNELYHHVEIPQITPQKNPVSQEQNGEEEKEKKNSTDSAANPCQEIVVEKSVMKKRKRKKSDDNDDDDDDKFEMFMGFCGNVVKKVIEKQEEMHKKVLEDILKREEESIAREEAWRNQEISKIEKEIELRAQEKANASEKEAKMVELLKNFMIPPFDSLEDQSFFKKMQGLFMPSSNYSPQIQDNPQFKITQNPENFSGVNGIVPLSSTLSLQKMEAFEAKDTGNRWPRDEVLALINIRCKLNNNSNNNEDKDSPGNKGPLWERISKGMMEMGYKRSAKRCKEKWENINKYFRKTKDIKKKRAEDSRTCPYFQQLSCLYSHQQQENEGLGHSDAPENC